MLDPGGDSPPALLSTSSRSSSTSLEVLISRGLVCRPCISRQLQGLRSSRAHELLPPNQHVHLDLHKPAPQMPLSAVRLRFQIRVMPRLSSSFPPLASLRWLWHCHALGNHGLQWQLWWRHHLSTGAVVWTWRSLLSQCLPPMSFWI